MGQYFDNDSNIVSKLRKTRCLVLDRYFTFYTDNGVFSKDGLDFGSRLLLESIPLNEVGGKILDMGCGYGVFGIVLASILKCQVDMVDVNLRAIHLAKMNMQENKVSNVSAFESNVYANVSKKYSCIITNPPIRAGKKVVYDILFGAKDYLEKDGKLFLVIRKEQGAKSVIIDLQKSYDVVILAKKKGFFVIECSIS